MSSENEQDNSRPGSPQIDDDEDTITMLDVLEDENKLQEEASAVLGNSDEKNCTYSKVSDLSQLKSIFTRRSFYFLPTL